MIIFRPVEIRDLIPLSRISQVMEEGITSLPRNPGSLETRIIQSVHSFASTEYNGQEIYLFVLEDTQQDTLIGTSQIIARTLGSTLGYYFRQEYYTQPANRLQEEKKIPILRPIRHMEEATELGGLFLLPSVRQKGLSKLLSLSRLLFIQAYAERFEKEIIAEIRGFTDEEKRSPFWQAIGKHFLDIQFDELMRQIAADPRFIPDVLAPFPIYLEMLPLQIQELAGKIHPQSEVALKRLFAEGFHHTGEIDIFDGGPKIAVETAVLNITKRQHTVRSICSLHASMQRVPVLLTNHHLKFRACLTDIHIQSPETVLIDPLVAEQLHITTGELVHYLPLEVPMDLQRLL